ncbi:MAG: thiamine pyrophosphate-binding protein [Vitreoscilla sp.]|nr:thiamine pyrophosphate-binding protein [Vitreoscilla sp.]
MHTSNSPRAAGHALVEALIAQGVDTVFGVPGESYLAVLDGFHEHRGHIRFITCRQEGGAAFMADAYARLTGRPGVCCVTRGPGATNAAIGVHTAFQDSVPLILLVGQVAADQRDREAFQELDYRQVFGPGTLGMAKWAAEVQSADRLPEYIARAFHVAMQGRPGPVVLALPEDLLGMLTAAPVVARAEPVEAWPAPGSLREVRQRLLAAERPFMIVGGHGWTRDSAQALQRFAENWNLPVGCAFRYQDVFDNHHPQYAGDVGIALNPALARRIRDESDLVLAIGVRLGEMTTSDYTLLEPPRSRQALIHLHPGAEELGRVYQADVALQASLTCAGKALETLAAPTAVPWAAWTASAQADYEALREHPPVEPLDLAVVVKTLERLAPPDAIYTNGAGNFAGWLHRYMRYGAIARHGKTQLAPTAGSMGYGLPAAVAASLVQPHRVAINLSGDGDFLMNGQELATAMAHGSGRLISIVVDNGGYGTIRMHQERAYPGRTSGTLLANPDFAALARAYGWAAATVEHTEQFEPAFRAALDSGHPTLLHLRLDPDVSHTRGTLSGIRGAALARQA